MTGSTAASRKIESATTRPLVSVLVVTYEPDLVLLEECLQSVAQAAAEVCLELVVVDNSDQEPARAVLERATHGAYALHARYAPQRRNLGYAAATNAGLALCRGELVLLLNPDARLSCGALPRLVEAAKRRPEAAGFAPKILLSDPGVVLDSVGMVLHPDGPGAQRGLGQADIGQYDLEEKVPGPCFAAALIRRRAFEPDRVGLLDRRYFMFYEDVDWSQRAQVLGESFWTVPKAVVLHFHSATTRHLASGFKTRLVQRNLVWSAAKNLEASRALRITLRRSLAALLRPRSADEFRASLRAVAEAWVGLPGLLRSRRQVQRRRNRPDRKFLGTRGEGAFFDVRTYRPEATLASLDHALRRRFAIEPDPRLRVVAAQVHLAAEARVRQDPARVSATVRASGIEVGPGLEWLLRQLELTDAS
ncbi:MAG: glycosyltransferase family 2 protein [Candidatus Dormibacteria bacterium]